MKRLLIWLASAVGFILGAIVPVFMWDPSYGPIYAVLFGALSIFLGYHTGGFLVKLVKKNA